MNQKIVKILIVALLAFLLGVLIGLINAPKAGKYSEETTNTSVETSIQPTEFTVKKGGVYKRKSFVDVNDPFNVPIIDTITVIDLQTSKHTPELIYVKWTFNNWHDTTRYLSTELSIFTINIEEIK
jgi:hypothetical protein